MSALVVLYLVLERRPEKVLIDGPLAMPAEPASETAEDASGVRFTPDFAVDGPTTLVVELERDAVAGFVGVGVALVHRSSGDVRQLALGTEWMPGAEGASRGSLRASARIDRVEGGTWLARLEPAWEPARAPLPARETGAEVPAAPSATIRIRQERRSPVHFWVAAGLIALPALVQIGRRLWYTRRHGGGDDR